MFSPKQYIIQQFNQLPFVGCYILPDWKETKLSPVIEVRNNKTVNFTSCFFMVDQFCIGTKDTFFRFNESVPIEEIVQDSLIEIDNNLAHNIIYTAYKYTIAFDIQTHKEFEITKHFLLPNVDVIPFIDIEVGGAHGNPIYLPYSTKSTQETLAKLNKNPVKGNYTFLIKSTEFDHEYKFEDDEQFDEGFNELTYQENEVVYCNEYESKQSDVVKIMSNLLVHKYNQFYFEEEKISTSSLLMYLNN